MTGRKYFPTPVFFLLHRMPPWVVKVCDSCFLATNHGLLDCISLNYSYCNSNAFPLGCSQSTCRWHCFTYKSYFQACFHGACSKVIWKTFIYTNEERNKNSQLLIQGCIPHIHHIICTKRHEASIIFIPL